MGLQCNFWLCISAILRVLEVCRMPDLSMQFINRVPCK